MKIGELAHATDTQVETVRYYEKQGLLPAPARSDGNYRIYDSAHVERLRFIRHCRSLDMSLGEVRALLRLKDSPGSNCGDVNVLLDDRIEHVGKRIRELKALEKQLVELRTRCPRATDADHCGILEGLAQPAESAKRPGRTPRSTTRTARLRSSH